MLKSNQQFPFILMTQRWNDELIIYELKTNLNIYSHFKWETDCKMMSSSQICDFAVFFHLCSRKTSCYLVDFLSDDHWLMQKTQKHSPATTVQHIHFCDIA